ncbi:MAG: NVEALA domain-containing protein [Tannerellaceae bacterium]|nr:NVEALA domain-containing protein [Tannerellaceae bacterium]
MCVVTIGVTFLFILSKSGNDEWNDFLYNNIEALASEEWSANLCAGYGSIDCSGYKVKYKISRYSVSL